MEHPVISDTRNRFLFLIIWAVTLAAHFFILKGVFRLETYPIIWDTAITSLSFAAFSLGIWYLIRYIDFDTKNLNLAGLNLFLSLLVSLGLWLFITQTILDVLSLKGNAYEAFFPNSLLYRGSEGLLLFTLISTVYLLIKYQYGIGQRIAEESNLKRNLSETQLRALQTRINPHFLFNSLNSIHSQIQLRPNQAGNMVLALSDYLRYSLQSESSPMVALGTELEQISRYLEIEKERFGSRLKININIQDGLKDLEIPRMLLQPLIENSIKYGVEERTEETQIKIRVSAKENSLGIEISNEMGESSSKKGLGTGLKSIEEILRIQYQGIAEFNVSNTNNLFLVRISIPIDA